MYALLRLFSDVAMAIIESRQVKESLEYTTEIDGKETTPMRLLFKKMPGNLVIVIITTIFIFTVQDMLIIRSIYTCS